MELINQIYENLKTELEITEGERFNPDLLRSKVNNAYMEVKTARRYPASYSEAMIERDMNDYYSQIRALALFDFNQTGSEGQTQFSEDGVSIHYIERDSLFYGVLPISRRG